MNKDQKNIEIDEHRAGKRAITLLVIRLALVAGFSSLAWLILMVVNEKETPFPPGAMLSTAIMLPVNLICLFVTSKFLRQEGQSLREILAPRRNKFLRDIGMGLVWQIVLFSPFVLSIMGTTWLLFGNGMFAAFETIFYNSESEISASPLVMLVLGIITVITFAPINAPIEEAVYRGYAQSRLMRKWSVAISIIISSLAFGLQHIFYGASFASAVIYFAAFTMWGAASGIIVYRQKRLFPITVAHFFVNLFTSLPSVLFPVLMLADVIKA